MGFKTISHRAGAAVLALALISSRSAIAQQDGRKLLEECRAKILAIESVSYSVDYLPEGNFKAGRPDAATFTVTAQRPKQANKIPGAFFVATGNVIGGKQITPGEVLACNGGERAAIIQNTARGKVALVDNTKARDGFWGNINATFLDQMIFLPLLAPEPWEHELDAGEMRLAGEEVVHGEACNIIEIRWPDVISPPGNEGIERVWIGQRDGLPRRYSHWNGPDGALGKISATVTMMSHPAAHPEPAVACEVPEGAFKREVQKSSGRDDGLLKVGTSTKEWLKRLTAAAGAAIPTPGKATVLHFWAPTLSNMFRDYDAMSRLQEMFDPKNVVVISVAVADVADAAQLLKERGCKQFSRSADFVTAANYQAEATFGLPVFYILDKEGNARFARRGFKGGEDRFIARWISGMDPAP